MCGTCLARVESAQHLLEVVLGVGGQRVPAGVHADRGAPRNAVVELDVRRLGLVELHVPVAVRGDLLLDRKGPEADLREGGAVRGEASRWECAGTWL